MFELAQIYAVVKSRQDLAAAIKLLDKDILLEAPAFRISAQGLAENEAVLGWFFRSVPDCSVVLEDHASSGGTLICWGTTGMTMTGTRFGVVFNGQSAQLPIIIQFAFKADLDAREVFFFDLSALCAQSVDAAQQVVLTGGNAR